MVSSRDTEERPSLSVILPQLYLGAERDVTQERLASLGISYVLSVNRCSPQPSFLPRSRYLRIPIDDSLWDDLLPWIPQALHFIDAAMSSGESVLVHCAAGISRSPAVAVAYIMHSLGMDLDHAYRFVKERRPSISPNFNFLGQLQHFQGTLRQKVSGGDISIQQLDNRLSPIDDSVEHADISHNMNHHADSVSGDSAHREDSHPSDQTQQRHSQSGKLQTLHLTLSHIQQQVQMPCEPLTPVTPAVTPTQLHFPGGSASLVEKRKRLTLLLTPLEMCPPSSRPARDMTTSRSVHSRGTVGQPEAKTQSGAGEAKEQGLLSPFSFTLNKLLGWGERVLLGGLLVHPVRMGQPALPYRC